MLIKITSAFHQSQFFRQIFNFVTSWSESVGRQGRCQAQLNSLSNSFNELGEEIPITTNYIDKSINNLISDLCLVGKDPSYLQTRKSKIYF